MTVTTAEPAAMTGAVPDFAAMRAAMVSSQLRTVAVTDLRLIAAMALVPRERFVPHAQAALAYRDTTLSLGQGRRMNLPLATARLINDAGVRAGERVLLIGAAGGYSAAVLADMGAVVTAVESNGALVALAREALAGVPNVTVVEGALEHGHPQGAPYDVLIVDGAVESLPDTLASQLIEGGRIATGVVERGVMRLARGSRGAGGMGLIPFVDIDSVILPGFARPQSFTF